jgi:TonB family protein
LIEMNSALVDWGESRLLSLFLIPSLLIHGLGFLFAMWAATLSLPRPDIDLPIPVQLMEVRSGGSATMSIGPGKGPGGPRTAPQLGVPVPPAQQSGRLETGSAESLTPSLSTVESEPPPTPVALPGPKLLAADNRRHAVNAGETSPDSLVQMPTREGPSNLPSSAASDLQAHQRSLAALKAAGEGPGIKALKEGAQIPGALKGQGIGTGPYGVPGGSRTGTGLAGGGSGTGSGGGSATGLRGLSNADFNHYLNQLKKRVESVWKYPENVTGVQKVAIRFALDRAGRLTLSEVLESSDARLNASALEAMRRASPFPAIPESLKDLANEPMIIRFEVAIRVRG